MLTTALGVGLGVFPLFATTPTSTTCAAPLLPPKHTLNDEDNDGDSVNLEDGEGSMRACVDCGNKAKRDCNYRMCRTCCKGRGYDCATHVKSTWVPAARRRERQAAVAAFVAGGGSSGSSSAVAKRPRLGSTQAATASHTSTSLPNTPRSFDATSTHQDASFKESLPRQVRAPAVFRCIRVTAIEDGRNEYVYQAMVKINGHVFKGFLYDQGVNEKGSYPCISELQLETNASGRNVDSSSPILHKADAYDASGCRGLLGGDQDCF
ncbi:protein LATERAL ROOT PRIMORDIUM 1-like isoform X3 [Vitis riparia]|uniref:protein LATERAL ROOT PRIMORDIUM 1-like isoform X3 n=1 Tax=Vitis riparia TaxID=96939 RepID=UPI00155A9219|nr:protein LATERAL ROOT PRIMORDIUM 1-like isoform X3 [Vitis riparia]